MKGLVADANIRGQVEYLVQRMQADVWVDFWEALGLVLYRFEDIGLSVSSSDLEVWSVCQAEQLVLITDNCNLDSDDSLEATIRRNNTAESLPVFTIADMNAFRTDGSYVERVIETLRSRFGRGRETRAQQRLRLRRAGQGQLASRMALCIWSRISCSSFGRPDGIGASSPAARRRRWAAKVGNGAG